MVVWGLRSGSRWPGRLVVVRFCWSMEQWPGPFQASEPLEELDLERVVARGPTPQDLVDAVVLNDLDAVRTILAAGVTPNIRVPADLFFFQGDDYHEGFAPSSRSLLEYAHAFSTPKIIQELFRTTGAKFLVGSHVIWSPGNRHDRHRVHCVSEMVLRNHPNADLVLCRGALELQRVAESPIFTDWSPCEKEIRWEEIRKVPLVCHETEASRRLKLLLEREPVFASFGSYCSRYGCRYLFYLLNDIRLLWYYLVNAGMCFLHYDLTFINMLRRWESFTILSDYHHDNIIQIIEKHERLYLLTREDDRQFYNRLLLASPASWYPNYHQFYTPRTRSIVHTCMTLMYCEGHQGNPWVTIPSEIAFMIFNFAFQRQPIAK